MHRFSKFRRFFGVHSIHRNSGVFFQHFTPNFGGCILYTSVCNKQDFTVKAKGIWKSLVCNLSIMVVFFFFTKHVDITIDRKIGSSYWPAKQYKSICRPCYRHLLIITVISFVQLSVCSSSNNLGAYLLSRWPYFTIGLKWHLIISHGQRSRWKQICLKSFSRVYYLPLAALKMKEKF